MPSKTAPPERPPEALLDLRKRIARAERSGADVAEARQHLLTALLTFRARRLEEMKGYLLKATASVDLAERARREEGLRRRLWALKESGADTDRQVAAEAALGRGALEEAEAALGGVTKKKAARRSPIPRRRAPLLGASEAALSFEPGSYQILLASPLPSGGIRVLDVRRGEVSAGGGEAALEETVVAALRSLRPRPRKVHVALPHDAHVLATVTLPPLPPKERPQALRWKLAKLCAFPQEESLLASRTTSVPGSVLGLMASLAVVRKAVGMVERAGLPVGRILAPGQSLACLLPPGPAQEARALLQIGRAGAQLYVFTGGEMTFSRDLGVGVQHWLEVLGTPISSTRGTVRLSDAQAREVLERFDISASENLVLADGTSLNDKDLMSLLRASVERLQDALSRSLEFAAGQEGGTPVARVFLCGEGAALHGLDRILSARAGIPVSVLPLPREGEPLLPVDALAASLFAASGKDRLLDLIPSAARTRATLARWGSGALAAGLLVTALFGGLALLARSERPGLQGRVRQRQEDLKKVEGTVEEINRDLKVRKTPPPAGDPPAFAILRALGEVLPPDATVQGLSLEMPKGERPRLLLDIARGVEGAEGEGVDVKEVLSRSPLLGSVEVEPPGSTHPGLTRYRCGLAMEPLP